MSVNPSLQDRKYSGKPFDRRHGLDLYDYGARRYDPALARWTSPDPLCENYYNISPYAFCHDNPVNRIDMDGMADFWVNGRVIGNDGVIDQKILVIRTEALTPKEVKETVNFIKTYTGNAEAFKTNGIAYNNSIAIEPSIDNRRAMIMEISKDNGKGGKVDANNMEYGGFIQNGRVVLAKHGSIANPKTKKTANIKLPFGVSTFHSHPSGNIVDFPPVNSIGGTTTYSYNQPPSQEDIKNAGTNAEMPLYMFIHLKDFKQLFL